MHRCNHRRRNFHDVATHDCSRIIHLHIGLPFEAQTSDWGLGLRSQLLVTRSFVDDDRVVVRDVRDVRRLINDGEVALLRHDHAFDSLFAELPRGHEDILVGSDVVVTIGPIADTASPIKAGFWRQWCPTNIIGSFAPRNPC